MARPAKSRRVCRLPLCQEFYGGEGNDSGITLTVEEYETIRLIDYMGFSQEECGRQMGGVPGDDTGFIYGSTEKTGSFFSGRDIFEN